MRGGGVEQSISTQAVANDSSLGTPSSTEIWYTTENEDVITLNNNVGLGAPIISNTYDNGKGIISCAYEIYEVSDETFSNCSSLVSVIIPDSVRSIGQEAFFNCERLTSVTIGDSVKSIGQEAFFACTRLTSVTIPDSVTSIGESAFIASGLLSVTFNPQTPPTLDNSFEFEKLENIYVPSDALETYKSAEVFTNYKNIIQPILPTELEYSYKTWASSLSYPLLETTTMPWSLTETALKTGNLMCYKYSGDTANSEYGNNHVEAFFIFKASTINVERTKVELMRIDYLDNEGNILETHGSQYDGKEVITSVKNTTEYGVASGVALYKGISDSPFKGCTENHYILRIPIQNYYYPSTSECTKRKLTFRMTFQSVDEEIKLKQELAVMQIGSQLVD